MNIKECFEQGLLKEDMPSKDKAFRSLEVAKDHLEKAKTLLKMKIFDLAEVSTYTAMFHASRALLFKDGLKERSHFAVYVYLKEKYSDKIEPKFLNELNVLRMERHEVFYGLDKTEVNVFYLEKTIALVTEFILKVKELL